MSARKKHTEDQKTYTGPVYLDCNATTPLEPEVFETLRHYLLEDFGNEGSRTHEFGSRAKQAVQKARDQVAALAGVRREEVIFTSGATESNNLAILGLAEWGRAQSRRHIVSSASEHKAVLEPFEEMVRLGFEVDLVAPGPDGRVAPEAIAAVLRPDTLLVSVMHANNETGVIQPLGEIAALLRGHPAFLHTDAAQTFGKELEVLRNPRIDFISVSGHKLYGPKGIGALIARRRGYERSPLRALMFGGGQERGLRPGTLPVAMIAALGTAAECAARDHAKRRRICEEFRGVALRGLEPLGPRLNGADVERLPHVLSLGFPGIDSEALIVGLKDLISISNGSACTSSSYTPSHVLKAMGQSDTEATETVRISWCHRTPAVDWEAVAARIRNLQ
jgi:cysteine desulfurase